MKYKKYIFGGFVGLLLVVTPVHADTLQDQYQATLVQIITLLQQQVTMLMAQLQALQVSQAQTATQVSQIVQNTTPVAPVFGSVVVPPEVKKEVAVDAGCYYHQTLGTLCNAEVKYFENGDRKDATVTLAVDERFDITTCNCNHDGTGKQGTQNFKGNPVTGTTVKSGYDGKPVAQFQFIASNDRSEQIVTAYSDSTHTTPTEWATRITRTVTATVNGITQSKTFYAIYYPPVPEI